MDVITTEGPILLGTLAVVAVMGLLAVVAYLNSSPVIETRRLNRQRRHARAGCEVCAIRVAGHDSRQELVR